MCIWDTFISFDKSTSYAILLCLAPSIEGTTSILVHNGTLKIAPSAIVYLKDTRLSVLAETKIKSNSARMTPRFETIGERKFIGKRLTMSLAQNKTSELWKSFMTERKEITYPLTTELVSLQIYPPGYFTDFNPATEFEKWAAAEVTDFSAVPGSMEVFLLPAGLYAVFHYKGSSSDNGIFQYIYGSWIPGSNYLLDERPHFEILGEKYKNSHPSSEEEIWIPIRPRPTEPLQS